MKFDPSTWTLQVGRKWRHCTIPELTLTEGENTRLDFQSRSLLGLIPSRDNSGGNYYSNMETIDEPIGYDQPIMEGTETVDAKLIYHNAPSSKEEFSQMSLLDREWFIYSTLQSLIQKINTMAGTITDLKNAVTAEETVEAGLITLVNGLGAQIKAALPSLSAADQATLDGVIASVTSDAAAMAAATTANTPAATTPAPGA